MSLHGIWHSTKSLELVSIFLLIIFNNIEYILDISTTRHKYCEYELCGIIEVTRI